MQCPNCGRQISNGARFCPVCGNSVPAGYAEPQRVAPVQPQPQPRQPRPQFQQRPVQNTMPPNRAMQPQPSMPRMQMNQQVPQPKAYAVDPKAKNMGIISLVLGILGILFILVLGRFWEPLFIIGLVFGIVGIVLASMSKSRGFKTALSTAGLVCSIVAVVFGAIYLIVVLLQLTLLSMAQPA